MTRALQEQASPPGWYADPEVEAVQVRWWDGAQWTSHTRRSRNYGMALPVRGRRARVWNWTTYALALAALMLGIQFLMRHFVVPPSDPGTVSITNLNKDIAPRETIQAACSATVRRVKHLEGWAGLTYQRWSVIPKPGHVDIAFLNTDTGRVTCP